MNITLITGASSGIGEAFTKVCAEDGRHLVLVARNESKLRAVAEAATEQYGVQADVIAMDLTEADAAARLHRLIADNGHQVNMLINNAGAFEAGAFADMSPDKLMQMLTLNMSTLTLCTRLFLDDMRAAGQGYILNVASMAAFQAIPYMACYAATKAFVLALSEALAEELKDSNIRVSALCPGLTDTEMGQQTAEKLYPALANLPDLLIADPNTIAKAGYDACLKGIEVEVPGIANKVVSLWSQTQPRWLLRKLTGGASRWLSSKT